MAATASPLGELAAHLEAVPEGTADPHRWRLARLFQFFQVAGDRMLEHADQAGERALALLERRRELEERAAELFDAALEVAFELGELEAEDPFADGCSSGPECWPCSREAAALRARRCADRARFDARPTSPGELRGIA